MSVEQAVDASLMPATVLEGAANPLMNGQHWLEVLVFYGVGFGATAGLFEYEAGMSWDMLANEFGKGIVGGMFLGALTALCVTPVLRLLRGRVSAMLGLFLTSLAAALPYLLILLQQDKLYKVAGIVPLWAFASVVLVPWTAVRRTRDEPVGWVSLMCGALAACTIMGLHYLA